MKSKSFQKAIENFIKKNGTKKPTLRCKPHKNDSALFCLVEKIFMCIECVKDHKDHSHEWIDGTNKKIYELFEQAV